MDSELNLLDLLIVGFPKAGTTSLASWLSTCEQCQVTSPKETFCLCPEFLHVKHNTGVSSVAEALGPRVREKNMLCVEATSLNVYSEKLLAEVTLHLTKIIIVTRDHASAVKSWHGQVILAGLLPSVTLREAWENLTSDSSEEFADFRLDYATLFKQGEWVERWIKKIGNDRVLLLNIQDLSDTESLKLLVSDFLGRNLSTVNSVPSRNSRYKGNVRFATFFRRRSLRRLSNMLDRLGLPMGSIKETVRVILGVVLFERKDSSPDDEAILAELSKYYAEDKILLDRLCVENKLVHQKYENVVGDA